MAYRRFGAKSYASFSTRSRDPPAPPPLFLPLHRPRHLAQRTLAGGLQTIDRLEREDLLLEGLADPTHFAQRRWEPFKGRQRVHDPADGFLRVEAE